MERKGGGRPKTSAAIFPFSQYLSLLRGRVSFSCVGGEVEYLFKGVVFSFFPSLLFPTSFFS
jgi:hypothetical protein